LLVLKWAEPSNQLKELSNRIFYMEKDPSFLIYFGKFNAFSRTQIDQKKYQHHILKKYQLSLHVIEEKLFTLEEIYILSRKGYEHYMCIFHHSRKNKAILWVCART